MSSTWYWINVLNDFEQFLFLTFFVSFMYIIFVGLVYLDSYSSDKIELGKKKIKYTLVCMAVISILLVFLPSKDTLLKMYGLSVVEKIMDIPKVKDISEKAVKVLEKNLDNQLKEGK